METNNSNTTVINENDVFSEESTYIDYSNIPDYTAMEYTNNYRTLSIQQFSTAFLNFIKQMYNESELSIWYFYLIDNNGYSYDINEINNLDKFILWNGKYIIDSDIETNKLLSFKTLKNKISFKVSYRYQLDGENRLQTTEGLGTPVTTYGDVIETKIISVIDLNYNTYYFPIDYFNIYQCFADYITELCNGDGSGGDDCDGHECEFHTPVCFGEECYIYNPNYCPDDNCLQVICDEVDCGEFYCEYNDDCDGNECFVVDCFENYCDGNDGGSY